MVVLKILGVSRYLIELPPSSSEDTSKDYLGNGTKYPQEWFLTALNGFNSQRQTKIKLQGRVIHSVFAYFHLLQLRSAF